MIHSRKYLRVKLVQNLRPGDEVLGRVGMREYTCPLTVKGEPVVVQSIGHVRFHVEQDPVAMVLSATTTLIVRTTT